MILFTAFLFLLLLFYYIACRNDPIVFLIVCWHYWGVASETNTLLVILMRGQGICLWVVKGEEQARAGEQIKYLKYTCLSHVAHVLSLSQPRRVRFEVGRVLFFQFPPNYLCDSGVNAKMIVNNRAGLLHRKLLLQALLYP